MGAELIKDEKGDEKMVLINEKYNYNKILDENVEAYDFLKILGRGENNCLTKKIYSKINNKIYVMKEIKFFSEEKRKQLIDIINILKNIGCQNIIKNHIYFQKDDTFYIINEFAGDGDLQDFVKAYKTLGKTIEKNILWKIFLQCAASLKYLHRHNIIHRDIRLENFLMTDEKVVKLGNFKKAILLKDNNINKEERFHDQTGGILYRSPEMRNLDYGKKTDIYSLGVVFYKLCFLDFPNSKIYKNNVNIKQFINKKYISKAMIEIINIMLNEDEKKRPDAEQLYDLIKQAYNARVVKNTSIISIFTCMNAYHKLSDDLEEKKNEFKNKEKTPFTYYYLNSVEQLKIKDMEKRNNSYINNFRYLLTKNYTKIIDNDQEINPVLVIDCLLERLNKEISNDFNGPSFKIQLKYNDKDEKIQNFLEAADNNSNIYNFLENVLKKNNYNSLISKYFVGFLETQRTCHKCQQELFNYRLLSYYEFDLDKCKKKNANSGKYEYTPKIEDWFNEQIDERQNIFCKECKCATNQKESKKFLLIRENLIIAINRGEDYNNQSKVDYSMEIDLNIIHFELVGVVKRMEDKGNEYFISIHLDHSSNTWVLTDNSGNSDKKEVNPIEHKEGLVVLLFYKFKSDE